MPRFEGLTVCSRCKDTAKCRAKVVNQDNEEEFRSNLEACSKNPLNLSKTQPIDLQLDLPLPGQVAEITALGANLNLTDEEFLKLTTANIQIDPE